VFVLWAASGVTRLTGGKLAGSKPSFLDVLHRSIIALAGGGSKATY